jgi:hypothetical protein
VWIAQAGDEIRPDAVLEPEGETEEEIVFREEDVGDAESKPEPEPEPAETAPDFDEDEIVAVEPEPAEPPETEEIAADKEEVAESDTQADTSAQESEADDAVEAGISIGDDAGEDKSGEDGQDIVAEFYGEDEGGGEAGESEKVVIGKIRRKPAISPGLAAGWGMLCLAIAAVGYISVSQRVSVVRALPGSAWIYDRLGLPVNVRGLDFTDVAYSWERDAGRVFLEVHGDIVNISDRRINVPTVVFALRGENESDVFQWEYDVVNEPLDSGESATFAVRIPTPPKSIKTVQVRFAKAR